MDPHTIWNGHQQAGQVSGGIALIRCIHIDRISFHTIKRATGNRVSR
jgi:non-homologous end joining protein Ku